MQRLNNKVALVTGGASGLGEAIAQRLASDGAKVVITDMQTDLGRSVAAEFGADFLPQDVTQEARWTEVVRQVRARYGGLHVLVNNAGILGPMDRVSPEDARLEDWRKVFAVNVEGVFLGCRATIPLIHDSGGGSIVNMSSVAGLLATPYATAYGASKAAVRQLTKSVAQHCMEKGMKIRCNSVHPGIVRTPLWDKQAQERAHKRDVPFDVIVSESAAIIPMGDLTRPEDVAAAVAFLASDDSRHMTGGKLMIDGGLIHCDTYSPSSSRRAASNQKQ